MRRALLGLSLLGVCAVAGAVAHPVSVLGRVYVDTNCNGIIDTHDVLVDGVSVELQLAGGDAVGIAQTGEFGLPGVYAFPSDMAPVAPQTETSYTLTIFVPQGFSRRNAVPGPYSTKVNNGQLRFNLPSTVTGTSSSYDFLIKQKSCFYSDTQCGWGSLPWCWGQTFLSYNYCSVYDHKPVVVGGANTLTFTSAHAIQNFLPQYGPVRILTASDVNPTSCRVSELAGNVLALKLNVDFSDAGVTTAFFGNLHVLHGPMAGARVRDVLAIANQIVGGDLSVLPRGMSLCDLNDVLERINRNFEDCDQNCHGWDHRHNHGCGGWGWGWDGYGCGCDTDWGDGYLGW